MNSKSPRIEAQLEELMDAHGLFYNRQEYYIEKDKMFEELYTLEV